MVFNTNHDQTSDTQDRPDVAFGANNDTEGEALDMIGKALALSADTEIWNDFGLNAFPTDEAYSDNPYSSSIPGFDVDPLGNNQDLDGPPPPPASCNTAFGELPAIEKALFNPKIKNMRQDLDLNLYLSGAAPMSDECWEKWQHDNFETDSEDEEWNETYRPKDYASAISYNPSRDLFKQFGGELPGFSELVDNLSTAQLSQEGKVLGSNNDIAALSSPEKVMTRAVALAGEALQAKSTDGQTKPRANYVAKPLEIAGEVQTRLPIRSMPQKHRVVKPYQR